MLFPLQFWGVNNMYLGMGGESYTRGVMAVRVLPAGTTVLVRYVLLSQEEVKELIIIYYFLQSHN